MNETAIETDTNADLARERVRANFHSLALLDSKWVWDWSSELNTTNIRGYCTGDNNPLKIVVREMQCNYPVKIKRIKRPGEQISGVNDIGIVCTRGKDLFHKPVRAVFRDMRISEMASSKEIEDVILTEIEKAVLRERDKRIVRERKLLNFRDGVLSLLLPGHKTKTRRRVKGNKSKFSKSQ